ncbi:DUF934 domain-containing protein [Deefgea rivuli]|uniref:DUF934 domain-containing protein n=1 Tax=Deefgea rivuli TaxID=400948 RepID=UPI00047F1C19|nr:DUF934 domain-containing protein [Deefgea rivuli]
MNKIIRIRNGVAVIENDQWQLIRDDTPTEALINQPRIVSFPYWLTTAGTPTLDTVGVFFAPNDDFQAHITALKTLPVLAVDFPSFRDGRGYSMAYLLRSRYGYQGELRAVGDVLQDQLFYMQRCGFDSFMLRADKNIEQALNGFSAFNVKYQGAVDDPVPLFRKRTVDPLQPIDEMWEP